MVNGLRREDDDDDSEEVLSEKEGRKERCQVNKEKRRTCQTNKWPSVLSFVCFWGLIHASTFTPKRAKLELVSISRHYLTQQRTDIHIDSYSYYDCIILLWWLFEELIIDVA